MKNRGKSSYQGSACQLSVKNIWIAKQSDCEALQPSSPQPPSPNGRRGSKMPEKVPLLRSELGEGVRVRAKILLLWIVLLVLPLIPIQAQTDCGVVDGMMFPVDTGVFTLAQDYGVASSRHRGRYHTGEDWYGGRDNSLGQGVRAAARGRVTYSSPNGWGRDGGVVILEHLFPDGTIFYTVYGHMMESGAYSFPTRLSCVERGNVIGAVADVRPAPHLHFEVRIEGAGNGTTPSAGYSSENPYSSGFRNPSKFVLNQQTWLSLWHEWHLAVGAERQADERAPISPLLTLNDNSLLYLDGTGRTLRRATPDGRVLWRIRLDTPAVSITAWRGASLLTLSDGTMQLVEVETGGLGDSWEVDAQFSGAPIVVGDNLLFPAPNNSLVMVSADRREIISSIPNIPPFVRYHLLPNNTLALLTDDQQFYYLSLDGTVIDHVQLRSNASFATSFDGNLLVYSRGGLWQVNPQGQWSLYIENAPSSDSGAIFTSDDLLYLFTGQRLYAYARSGNILWEAGTPAISGLMELERYEGITLITSNHGDVMLVNQQGAFCNQVRVFGQDNARLWQELGADNLLRIAIADQILALNWNTFIRPCNA